MEMLDVFSVGDRVYLDNHEEAGQYIIHRIRTVSGKVETPDTWVDLCLPDNAPGPYVTATASQLRKVLGVELSREYYVLVDGSCDNKTSDPAEALNWAKTFRADGCEDVYIVDVDNNRVDERKLNLIVERQKLNMVAYVIRSYSESDPDEDGFAGVFWSNVDGWGSLEAATRFTTLERMDSFLPMSAGGDSEWMLIEEAEDLVKRNEQTNALWANNLVQFSRLLTEIMSTQELDYGALVISMDLSKKDIDELFDRANDAWEAHKAAQASAVDCT